MIHHRYMIIEKITFMINTKIKHYQLPLDNIRKNMKTILKNCFFPAIVSTRITIRRFSKSKITRPQPLWISKKKFRTLFCKQMPAFGWERRENAFEPDHRTNVQRVPQTWRHWLWAQKPLRALHCNLCTAFFYAHFFHCIICLCEYHIF